MAKLDDDDEEDDGLCLDSFQRFLEKAGCGNEILAIEISYGEWGTAPYITVMSLASIIPVVVKKKTNG